MGGPISSSASEHPFFLSGRARLVGIEAEQNDGRAASLLVRGGWKTRWQDGLSTHLEVDAVSAAWQDDHNNAVDLNHKPMVPDVEGVEVNQAFIQWRQGNTTAFIGRRRIELDDQRFVGSNGFWQNDQTFDSASLSYSFWSASTVQYHYIHNVNRILGNHTRTEIKPGQQGYVEGGDNLRSASLLGDHEHRTHLVHARFNEWDQHTLTGFYYHMDNREDRTASNQTLGLRYEHNRRLGVIKSKTILSVAAQQRDPLFFDGPVSDGRVNADTSNYFLLDTALSYRSSRWGGRYEKLSANERSAFITPLASLHDFHGWADRFNVSTFGMVDRSLYAGFRQSPWRVDVRHHWFRTDLRDFDWGREWDVDITYKLNRDHKILVRFADFQSASQSRAFFPDERRVYLNYSFNLL